MKLQNKKCWTIIKLIICIMLSLSLAGCMNISKKRRVLNREKVKVESYLQAKYGKEFVVTDAEFRRPELGKIRIDTTAYPKENKKLKFRVTASPEEGGSINSFDEDYRNTFYYDEYLVKYWSLSAEKEMKVIVEKNIGENLEIVEIYASPSAESGFNRTNIWGYTPEYKDIKNKNPEKINVILSVVKNKEYIDIQEESEKIKSLIDEIRSPKMGHYQLTFDYYTNGKRYLCTIWKADIDVIESVENVSENFKIIDN